ncbi:MAG: HEPN domain-containing protein [Bradyrhizobium sp.]|uniref:HEPN domain-containing protein n=1 Tax=Bradyrhizobium sp. TaxID=376 RepID=UPI00272FA64F|nr:HEPN domain-containing protein [Bradyrhizobium sp.]MDP1869197.1 HEPN domain-containing protein [Bradyrhizobium sp.]
MKKAAHRHLEAAEKLFGTNRKDVAGYLFGLAAECALKHIMMLSGMRPLPENQRRDDPYYAHFENLKTLLRNTASGRRAGELRRYVEAATFMQQWDISMRYSDGKDIRDEWINRWRSDARNVVGAMDS